MKFASHRLSPHKQQPCTSQNIELRNLLNARIKSQRCYMHYNNAVYMGGMISYKRNGQGILLLDDGTSILTDYCYDSMVGHNIIYRKNAIISVLFIKGSSYEIVMRTEHYIFQIFYDEKQQTFDGSGLLIDFKDRKIYHLVYQYGKVIRKITESNKDLIQQIFNNKLAKLISSKHENAFKFRFKRDNGIKLRREEKKIVIGYIDSQDRQEGLCFKLKIDEDAINNYSCQFDMQCLQRGYYSRNKLYNFGQRYFSNGNLYIGEFENDCFHGKGLLVYPNQSKWVYGYFENERLKKMLNMNISQNERNNKGQLQKCMKEVHQFNTKNYMSVNVSIISWQYLKTKLGEANFAKITGVVVEKEKIVNQEQERLIMIQQHFINETPNHQIDRVMLKQMDQSKIVSEKVLLNEFGSLKPKVLQIESRCTQGQGNQLDNPNRYFSKPTLTPKNEGLRTNYRNNMEHPAYDIYGSLTPNSKSQRMEQTQIKSSKSPIKRYGQQFNGLNKY